MKAKSINEISTFGREDDSPIATKHSYYFFKFHFNLESQLNIVKYNFYLFF